MEKITRICLIGPECTGKTDLAGPLAAHYRTVWVPEYARVYAMARDNKLRFEDVEPIARGQMRAEDIRLAPDMKRIILDTDLISTVVYSRHYYGKVPSWVEAEARRRRADLYLLMDVDLPWKPDPARDAGVARAELLREFEAAMKTFSVRYQKVSGSTDRLKNAIAVIDRVIK